MRVPCASSWPAGQMQLQLQWTIRLERHELAGVVKRGHRALDELNALR